MEIRLANANDIDIIFEMFFKRYKLIKSTYHELPVCNSWRESIYEKLKELILDNPSVVAVENEVIVGYLSGYCPISNYKGSQKGVFTPEWGHCVNHNNPSMVYNLMMSKIWTLWLEKRCYNHCISYLSDNIMERYLFDMSYGSIVEDAILDLEDMNIICDGLDDDIKIRIAEESDIETLLAFVTLFINKLNEKPIFRYGTPSTIEEVKYEFFEKDGICLVAEKNGRVIACMRGHFGTTTNSDLVCNDTNIAIDYAFVNEEYRGKHIAKKLLIDMGNLAKNIGMKTCTVDYETYNYNAAIFWRKYFRVFTKSLLRKIDDRF